MLKTNLLLQTRLKTLFLGLVACICFSNIAYANDDKALKIGFLNLTGFLIEGTANDPWRVVSAKNQMHALMAKPFILNGRSNDKGEILFSKEQRQALYSAWQKTPNQLWLVYVSRTYQIVPVGTPEVYQFDLVIPESDADKARREADEKAAIERQKPLNASTYTQTGFDAQSFTKDFSDWQQRFKQDFVAFNVEMKKDHEYGKKLFNDKNQDGLKQTFGQSIDTGKKGLSLRGELISAYYAAPSHEGNEVSPSGKVFTDLVLSEAAKPVGYGGTFSDENTQVELWYMVFDDMTSWTMQDFNDSMVFEAFKLPTAPPAAADAAADPAGTPAKKAEYKLAELPAYKTIKRSSWPALVFTREPDGKIQLYGMSMEMAKILGHIYNMQIF